MRVENGKKCTKNEESTVEIARSMGCLTNLPKYLCQHQIYLEYLTLIHSLACRALDSDVKLTSFDLELPQIGVAHFSVTGNNVTVTGVDLEEEAKSDILNAVTSGTSPITEKVNKKFVTMITQKFSELI